MSTWGFEWGAPWGAAAETEGAAWLLYMIREGPNVQGWSEIVDYRSAQVIDTVRQVRDAYDLDDADGDQLDTIGEWIGFRREGLVDTDYRRGLRAHKNVILSSSGSGPTVLATWEAWIGTPPDWYHNVPPAQVEIGGVVDQNDERLLVRFLRQALPGGVVLTLVTADDDGWLAAEYLPDDPAGPVSTVEVVGRDFDGVDDRIDFASVATLTNAPATFSAWVRRPSTPAKHEFAMSISGSLGSDSAALWINATTGQLRYFHRHASGLHRVAVDALSPGVWHMVTATVLGTSIAADVSLYIDGLPVSGYSTTINGTGTKAVLDGVWSIGGATAGAFLTGIIPIARAWDHVLTPTEVWAEYRSPGQPAKTSGLLWAPSMDTLVDPISGLTGVATGTTTTDVELPDVDTADYTEADSIPDAESVMYAQQF